MLLWVGWLIRPAYHGSSQTCSSTGLSTIRWSREHWHHHHRLRARSYWSHSCCWASPPKSFIFLRLRIFLLTTLLLVATVQGQIIGPLGPSGASIDSLETTLKSTADISYFFTPSMPDKDRFCIPCQLVLLPVAENLSPAVMLFFSLGMPGLSIISSMIKFNGLKTVILNMLRQLGVLIFVHTLNASILRNT